MEVFAQKTLFDFFILFLGASFLGLTKSEIQAEKAKKSQNFEHFLGESDKKRLHPVWSRMF